MSSALLSGLCVYLQGSYPGKLWTVKAELWEHRVSRGSGRGWGPLELRYSLQNAANADLFKGNARNLELTEFLKSISLGWMKYEMPPSCETLGAIWLWLFSNFLLDYLVSESAGQSNSIF